MWPTLYLYRRGLTRFLGRLVGEEHDGKDFLRTEHARSTCVRTLRYAGNSLDPRCHTVESVTWKDARNTYVTVQSILGAPVPLEWRMLGRSGGWGVGVGSGQVGEDKVDILKMTHVPR